MAVTGDSSGKMLGPSRCTVMLSTDTGSFSWMSLTTQAAELGQELSSAEGSTSSWTERVSVASCVTSTGIDQHSGVSHRSILSSVPSADRDAIGPMVSDAGKSRATYCSNSTLELGASGVVAHPARTRMKEALIPRVVSFLVRVVIRASLHGWYERMERECAAARVESCCCPSLSPTLTVTGVAAR